MFRVYVASTSRSLTRPLATHATSALIRHNWKREEIQEIYDSPLLDLVYRASSIHREHHDPSKIQLCTLMNIKSMTLPLCPVHFLTSLTWQRADALKIVCSHKINGKATDLRIARRFVLFTIVKIYNANQGFPTR